VSPAPGRRDRSKTLAAWLALIGGSLGLHRFYLHGATDPWGWLLWLPTAAGGYGVWRMREFGQDDQLAWVLIPWLGLALAATLLQAVLYALTPDERWNPRLNPGGSAASIGGLNIVAAILAGAIGAIVLIASIAFVAQRAFEYATLTRGADAQRNIQRLAA
jgi:hypothetical protein